MMKKAFTLLVENFFIITCCPERARELEKDYNCKVLHYIENPLIPPPHCHWGKCLKLKEKEI